MLKESLANALHDPTMDLALEKERVDGAAEIVDDGVALDCHDAGIGIDLDLDDVAAVGEGLSWRYAVMRRIEPRLHARRPRCRPAGRSGGPGAAHPTAKPPGRRPARGPLNPPPENRTSCAEPSRRRAASCAPSPMIGRPAPKRPAPPPASPPKPPLSP